MRLTGLRAENWMGYATIDLDFEGVAQVAVTGRNNHGKSALLDAVEWCLWGRIGRDVDQRSADQFVRDGTDLMALEVSFEAAGREVTVRREKPKGKTSTVGLTVDGVEQRGHVIGRKGDEGLTLDESQARIDALVGLGFDAITAGPFMAQEQASFFMKASPRDRKDLLIRLLGVDQYEPLARVAAKKADELEGRVTYAAESVGRLQAVADAKPALDAQLAAANAARDGATAAEEAAVAAYRSAREEYIAADAGAQRHTEARERLSRARQALERAEASVVSRQASERVITVRMAEPAPERPSLPDLIGEDAVEQAANHARATREEANREAQVRAQADAFRGDLERAQRARATAATVPCGAEGVFATCRFLTEVPSAEEVANAERVYAETAALLGGTGREDAARAAETTFRTIVQERARIDRLHADAERAEAQYQREQKQWAEDLERARASVAEAEGLAAAAKAELDAAGEAFAAIAPVDLTALQAQVRELQMTAQAARNARETADAHAAEVNRTHAVAEQAVAALEQARAEMAAAEAEASSYRLLAKAWHRDGIPTSLIEAAVPVIEAKANAVLERMPEDLSLTLRTQRPTKAGGMAETLDVVVTIDGWERTYALLSVGARFRVDLALRLALADLLTTRTGATIETLWLDEPLAALDDDARAATVETLTALGDDFGLIVVVSHHDDMNDRFPARIRVVKEEGVSTATMEQ